MRPSLLSVLQQQVQELRGASQPREGSVGLALQGRRGSMEWRGGASASAL